MSLLMFFFLVLVFSAALRFLLLPAARRWLHLILAAKAPRTMTVGADGAVHANGALS